MRIFVLDDDNKRQSAFWCHYSRMYGAELDCYSKAYSADEAIDLLLSQPPFDIVQLDHDLDGKIFVPSGPGTGYEVACFMANAWQKIQAKRVIVHTLNFAGATYMLSCFVEKGIPCEYRPFGVWEP